jgi:thioredoxin 1
MASTAVTAASFQDTVRAEGIVLVDWWAGWCAPCRAFSPVFEAASQTHPDVVFAKVDTEAEEELSRAAGIRAIPTLMAFRDGVLVYSEAGTLSADMLDRLIAGVRSLDMDAVREQLAAQIRP